MIRRRLIPLMIILLLGVACDDSGTNPEPKGLPETQQEIQEALDNAAIVGKAAVQQIDAVLNAGGDVDVEAIAAKLEDLPEVVSAEPTQSGSGIVVLQTDGTHSNILVADESDTRMWKAAENPGLGSSREIPQGVASSRLRPSLPAADYFPNGTGRAVILAPFQWSFKTDLAKIEADLQNAGFVVDRFENAQASIDRFRADFLARYDVVFIRSHGLGDGGTWGGERSTMIATGDESKSTVDPRMLDGTAVLTTTDGRHWLAVGVPWLEATSGQDFHDTWIYVGGCETAMYDSGSKSLSAWFFAHGSGGYNGFDQITVTPLSNPIAEKMSALFTSGRSLTDAASAVRNDWGLQLKAWFWRIISPSSDDPYITVSSFDDLQRDSSDPYYLIDPQTVMGTAAVIPDHGPPGTAVIYRVVISAAHVSDVAAVEFDIDNTDEHITMVRTADPAVWQRDGLTAPTTSEGYPRIDTFTFTAYDRWGGSLGTGAATFTIHEPQNASAIKPSSLYELQ